MIDFNENFKQLMVWEKGNKINGYVNDKDDLGGETIYGITRKNYPTLKIWQSLDGLNGIVAKRSYVPSEDEMGQITKTYKKLYWDAMRLSFVNDDRIAHYLFDFAVNSGVKRAVKVVQSLVGVSTDGICGGQTVNAINKTHSKSLLTALIKQRENYLNSIVVKNPSQKKFLNGWLRRCRTCVDWLK